MARLEIVLLHRIDRCDAFSLFMLPFQFRRCSLVVSILTCCLAFALPAETFLNLHSNFPRSPGISHMTEIPIHYIARHHLSTFEV